MSKYYVFVEFEEYIIVEIVVKIMDNYFLFGYIFKFCMIFEEDVYEDLFKGVNKRFKKVLWVVMCGK